MNASMRMTAMAAAVIVLSGCGSQAVRQVGDTSPFCLLVGGGLGAGTAAALGAAAGPIGLAAVVGGMLGGLTCPEHPAAPVAMATSEYAKPQDATPPAPPPAPEAVEVLDSDGDGVADNADRCPDTARGTNVDRRGCPDILLTLTGLHFTFDSSDIEPASAGILDDAVTALGRHEAVDVRIEGHTDSVGTETYNLALSQRRADAVLDYLVRHGVARSRLTTQGKGETQPVAANDTAAGRYRNRRVEFRVVAEGGDSAAMR